VLAPLRAHDDGATEGRVGDELEIRAGDEAELTEVAEQVGVTVGNARDRRADAGLEVEQRAAVRLHDAEVAIRDGVAVRVVRRISQLLVDLRLELLGERVLEELRLGMDLVEREPEAIDQVALEQPVMPEDLERAQPTCVGEGDAPVRESLDEAELVEALRHRGGGRGADPHAARKSRRRDALARGLERVDRLQVVLDGDGEIRGLAWHWDGLRLHSDSELDMAKERLTRGKLLAAAAPLAAVPLVGKVALAGDATAGGHDHSNHGPQRMPANHLQGTMGHAAMVGDEAPAVGGPTDLDALLYPPPALPYRPGRVREYTLTATDADLEVAPGVSFPGWVYNGTAPGPVIRATEGDLLRVHFVNGGSHPHTIHFHGIHPTNMDGVFQIVDTGGQFTYEFEARPAGMQLYHCHSTPLKKHIHKGLHGAFIIDPKQPRPPAQELVMVMNGFDTDGDGGNNFYTVNGRSFYYARYPIRVKRSELVRIYLANLTEFDLLNSFHLHADFFRYQPTGTGENWEYTDTVMLCQGQRGVIEIEFAANGLHMFHAHQSEFTELGWMGFFEVVD
jgi:FtsP/CotA-like multicopper oxidase with cupredoxin domain